MWQRGSVMLIYGHIVLMELHGNRFVKGYALSGAMT